MREFSSKHSYPQPPAALLALWRDPEFLAAVNTRFGGVGEPTIVDRGDSVLVRTRRELPVDKIPALFRRFLASGTLEQTDEWPREPAAPIRGRWSVSASMPASMSGTQEILADGSGCAVVVAGSVTVNAPLVGRRAEDLVVREITKLIGRQQEFAATWLAGERPAPPGPPGPG